MNRYFSKRRPRDGQQTHEKKLSITHHQGNADENYNEIPPHTCQNGKKKKKRKRTSVGHDCEEKGTLLHCWWECKLVQPLWKTVRRFLKKLKIELPYDPGITLLGIYPKNTKTLIQTDTCTPMFIAALFK